MNRIHMTSGTLLLAAVSALGQPRTLSIGAVPAHEINSLFLSHLEAQARHGTWLAGSGMRWALFRRRLL